MLEKITLSRLAAPAALLMTCALFAVPTLAGDEDQVIKKRVVKMADCDGDDCGEQVHKVKMIGEDGEVVELEGEAALEWIEANGMPEGDGDHKIVIKKRHACEGDDCPHGGHEAMFVGDDGKTVRMHLGDGNHWVSAGPGPGDAFLGVQLTELTDDLRLHFGAPEGAGVMVAKVVDGSAAAKAGVKVGDVIAGVDGEPVGSARALGHAIRSREAGDGVLLEIWRGGKVQNMSATLEKNEGGKHRMRHRSHSMSGAGEGEMAHVIEIDCDDPDGDCDQMAHGGGAGAFDCGSDTCEVMVNCDGDECSCTVNGESTDCDSIPAFRARRGE